MSSPASKPTESEDLVPFSDSPVAIPKFLNALYDLLENNKTFSDIIRWDETGTQFVVRDNDRLASTVLPTRFRHKNYCSFVRQLNIYGFHKGKNEDGCDVYRQPMFIRGKRMLLRFIPRSQNKVLPVARQTSSVEEAKSEVSNYVTRLAQEITKIQKQQLGLDSLMLELDRKNTETDLSTQGMMNRFYTKEMQNNMGIFALFMIGQYLNRGRSSSEVIGSDLVSTINRNVRLWIGDRSPPTECHFARHVYFTFNIEDKPMICTERAKMSLYIRDFLNWLKEFVKRNDISFPYVDTFFDILIITSLKKLDPDIIFKAEKSREYVATARGILETMFDYEEPESESEKQSTDVLDGSWSISPSTNEFKDAISLGGVSDDEAPSGQAKSIRSLRIEELNQVW